VVTFPTSIPCSLSSCRCDPLLISGAAVYIFTTRSDQPWKDGPYYHWDITAFYLWRQREKVVQVTAPESTNLSAEKSTFLVERPVFPRGLNSGNIYWEKSLFLLRTSLCLWSKLKKRFASAVSRERKDKHQSSQKGWGILAILGRLYWLLPSLNSFGYLQEISKKQKFIHTKNVLKIEVPVKFLKKREPQMTENAEVNGGSGKYPCYFFNITK
jgi:hypothetical protein